MRGALHAEVRRLASRRLTLVALVVLVAIIGLFQLSVADMVSPPSAADRQLAQQQAEEERVEWEAHHEEWEQACRDDGGSAADCAMPAPTASDWIDGPYPFSESAAVAVSFGVYLTGLVAFLVAASFVGAEFTTGSLANWLTFVPRRSTVFVSKLTVVAAFSLLLGLLAAALTVGAAVLITSAYGQPLSGLGEVVQMAARGALVSLILGVLGFCCAMLTGSTGASVGILLGGLFALFARGIVLFAAGWAARLSPWSPEVNAQAIVEHGTTYWLPTPGSTWDDDSEGIERQLSFAHGLGYWSVVLAAVIVVSWLLFRRRDLS
ncbi:MAG TPA: ABC transporter permease subunit [Microlunatus sp.]|nr:ABC transporter permease subunit [Microlunatus sp.]